MVVSTLASLLRGAAPHPRLLLPAAGAVHHARHGARPGEEDSVSESAEEEEEDERDAEEDLGTAPPEPAEGAHAVAGAREPGGTQNTNPTTAERTRATNRGTRTTSPNTKKTNPDHSGSWSGVVLPWSGSFFWFSFFFGAPPVRDRLHSVGAPQCASAGAL